LNGIKNRLVGLGGFSFTDYPKIRHSKPGAPNPPPNDMSHGKHLPLRLAQLSGHLALQPEPIKGLGLDKLP